MIYTASVGPNAPVFMDILKLHVPVGSDGCDVTYGRGVFWSSSAREHIGILHATDLMNGVCLSALPYGDGTMVFHVLDPPYMSGFFRKSNQTKALCGTHKSMSWRYGNHGHDGYKGHFYHAAVEKIYEDGLTEAWRVLQNGGIQITKVQDEVDGGKQHLTHCHVINFAESLGFEVLDLFVVVRPSKPHGKLLKNEQRHARKNHSYFLVFKKPTTKNSRRTKPVL